MNKRFGLMISGLGVALGVSACVGEEAAGVGGEEGQEVRALEGKADPGGPITPQGGCWRFPPTPCGELQNNSVRAIDISLNWNCTITYDSNQNSPCALSREVVTSGNHRGGGNIDVDAFRVDTGCTYYGDIDGVPFQRGPGWYKFASDETVTITSTSCGLGS